MISLSPWTAACPVVSLKDFIDWGLEDPIGQPVEKYRQG